MTTGIVEVAAAGFAFNVDTVAGADAPFVLLGTVPAADAEVETGAGAGAGFFSGDFGLMTVDAFLDPAPALLAD